MLRLTRRLFLLACCGAPFTVALGAQELSARLDQANILHVLAPGLHFLKGKSLERLKDGATVAILGQLTLSLDANVTIATRAIARFALSYDIWEERFSVSRFAAAHQETAARGASHLSPEAAEAWCLDHLTVDTSVLPIGRQFWIRLELRIEDGREGNQIIGEPGINLTRLIEIFSRPARAQQQRWQLDAGPLHLADLRRSSS